MTYIDQICDSFGVVLRREALEYGIDDNALRRLVLAKHIVRLRHGAYCLRENFRDADDRTRHLLLCRAVMRQYGDHVVLSHGSSCLIQGGPAWGLDLVNAHVTHLEGGGRKNSRIVHHLGACRVGDVRRVNGHWVTTPARAVLETATIAGVEASFAQANFFLHAGLLLKEELVVQYDLQQQWPGSLRHHPILLLADQRIESLGESRSAYFLWVQGLPRPEPQFEIYSTDGVLAGRVDFAWPEYGVILEFDGREKYHRLRKPGETIEQMVEREKKREDALRELTGWIVIRITWSDLATPELTAARIRKALHSRRFATQRLGA